MEKKECSCCKTSPPRNCADMIKSFEKKRDNLIPIMHAVQDKMGYLSEEAMQKIADWLEIPVSEVCGTAGFYTLFYTEPKGKYIVRLCDSPPCHIEGSKAIKSVIESSLGIKPGQTTKDGRFTFEIVSCMGLCGVAPAIMINDDVFGNLTPEKTAEILSGYGKES